MNDVIGMSDVSSPDTGRGKVLKTGGRKMHSMKKKPKLGKEDKCKKWKQLGYSSLAGCRHDNPKVSGFKKVTKKAVQRGMQL